MVRLLLLSTLLLLGSGCDSAPRYTGVGDVVAVDAAAHEVEIRHDQIAGLSDAATSRFALPRGEIPAALTAGARVRFEVRRERDALVLTRATALAAGNPGIHDHTPHHGGVVAMAGMIHLEARADPSGRVQLYLTDVWRRSLPLVDTTGTVTLDLPSGKRTLPLGVAGEALEVQAEPMPAERKPGIGRDGANFWVRLKRERVEAFGALLDLRQRQRASLELEAWVIEQDLLPNGARHAHVFAAQIQIAGRAEQRGQAAQAKRRNIDEIQN